ncbi:MAG: peptidoglycan DD-metalloendopeptidase family protein [Deltaproteobacteria bacterium]|nr:peptidoglycan DD-metalloendopeptidase family protein [Deltaproteobacteria bacterium]
MFYILKTIFKSISFFTVIFIISCFFADAGFSAPKSSNLKKEAEVINKKIKDNKKSLKKIAKKEKDIINSLDKTDIVLNKKRAEKNVYEKELNDISKRVKAIKVEKDKLKKKLDKAKEYAGRRLAAVYKLNNMGTANIIMFAETTNQFLELKYLTDKIIGYDQATLEGFIKDAALLAKAETELATRSEEKKRTEAKLKKNIDGIKKESQEKKRLLTRIKKEKSVKMAAVKALKAAAKNLDKKIAALGRKKSYTPNNKIKGPSFKANKGRLDMPIKGKIVLKFGPYRDKDLNITNYSSGITIKAARGGIVRAVFGGSIIFADWLKGYGNVIIIDHGKSYYTLYAHTESMRKKLGDTVKTGDILANVGDGGSITGTKLHFEIRHHGEPVNPMNWFKKG